MRWYDAEPDRLQREVDAMASMASDLTWNPSLGHPKGPSGGGWEGIVPAWPFDRPAPDALGEFLDGQRLHVVIVCQQAHPAVIPAVYPVDPEPDVMYRTLNSWHVAGDGRLCLTQRAYDWIGDQPAAQLIPKAAGWLIEYLLVVRGHVDKMTEVGIAASGELDHLITALNEREADGAGE